MKFSSFKTKLPSLPNSLLSLLSAILLILAFPGFEFWYLAWFALVPLFWAIEKEKESPIKAFVTGWIFGTIFFFGSCWWLTFAPVHYAGIPAPVAYFLLLGAASVAGFFPAIFALALARLLKRFGNLGFLLAPFLWTAVEFLRFYTTGNNWNAIAYSQAFHPFFVQYAGLGGIYLIGFAVCYINVLIMSFLSLLYLKPSDAQRDLDQAERELQEWQKLPRKQKTYKNLGQVAGWFSFIIVIQIINNLNTNSYPNKPFSPEKSDSFVIAIQPNVPMSGLNYEGWQKLRERHAAVSERAVQELRNKDISSIHEDQKIIVIFPESPMNFMYARDREFQEFLKDFTTRNNISVLFNAAEPTQDGKGLHNSAVLVNERGEKTAQYDKIYLLPFGEFVPLPEPLSNVIPPVVGNFVFGKNYNLIPLGEARGGTMICFESHFPNLSRKFVREGADVLIEMTNDGYLGNTPILRQHLANAVFRAVETNRPVLRVTNVGVTAYINERGEIFDAADVYTEATRVWTVKKSDNTQTFYVKYGDWLAWLSSLASFVFLILSFRKRKEVVPADERG